MRKDLHLNLKVKKRPTHLEHRGRSRELFCNSLEAIFIIFKAIKYGLKIQQPGRIMRISAPLNREFCTVMHWLTLKLFTPLPLAQLLKRFAAITSMGSWELPVLGFQHIFISLTVHVSLQIKKLQLWLCTPISGGPFCSPEMCCSRQGSRWLSNGC